MNWQIKPCRADKDDNVIWVAEDDEAEFFGVYRGEPGDYEWLADFVTREEAEDYIRRREAYGYEAATPWRVVPAGMTALGEHTHDDEGNLVIGPYRGRHIVTEGRNPVCEFIHDPDDARRIVACVNACEGIATAALECSSRKEITDRMFSLIEQMALHLKTAVERIKIANTEGNPILSAWCDDAERSLKEAAKLFPALTGKLAAEKTPVRKIPNASDAVIAWQGGRV